MLTQNLLQKKYDERGTIYFDSEKWGEKIVEAMCYKENQMKKVKRQSQLKQNSYIALVKYLIHTVLIIMLSFFITKLFRGSYSIQIQLYNNNNTCN